MTGIAILAAATVILTVINCCIKSDRKGKTPVQLSLVVVICTLLVNICSALPPPPPTIIPSGGSHEEKVTVEIISDFPVLYTVSEYGEDAREGVPYTGPFVLRETATVTACSTFLWAQSTQAVVAYTIGSDIELSRSELELHPGEVYQLAAVLIGGEGALTWSSGDEAVAAVDAAGRVTAVAPGDTAIQVRPLSHGDAKAICHIRVVQPKAEPPAPTPPPELPTPTSTPTPIPAPTPAPTPTPTPTPEPPPPEPPSVAGVEITFAPGELVYGARAGFGAQVYPDGVVEPLLWSSSDPSVADIDTWSGALTVVGFGPVTITAQAGGCTDSRSYYVASPDVALDCDQLILRPGEAQQLCPVLFSHYDGPMEVWWGSDDTGVADVDGDGLVYALSPGQCTVWAEVDSVYLPCDVIVEEEPPEIAVSEEELYTVPWEAAELIYQVDAGGCAGALCVDILIDEEYRFTKDLDTGVRYIDAVYLAPEEWGLACGRHWVEAIFYYEGAQCAYRCLPLYVEE